MSMSTSTNPRLHVQAANGKSNVGGDLGTEHWFGPETLQVNGQDFWQLNNGGKLDTVPEFLALFTTKSRK